MYNMFATIGIRFKCSSLGKIGSGNDLSRATTLSEPVLNSWILRNKFQRNFNEDEGVFILENAIKYVASNMTAIFAVSLWLVYSPAIINILYSTKVSQRLCRKIISLLATNIKRNQNVA